MTITFHKQNYRILTIKRLSKCLYCLFAYSIWSFYMITYLKNKKNIDNPIIGMKYIHGLSVRGLYPGDERLKKDKDEPVYTQRTSFLYYSRQNVGNAMIWNTLFMGVIGNLKEIISDKKISLERWQESDPVKFKTLQKYLPKYWSNDDNIDLDEDSIYVFKPATGADGNGILFQKGSQIMEHVSDKYDQSWVIQEFVNPYLYNERKSNFRIISFVLVRLDGTREFYLYRQMKMLTAPRVFEESLLFDEEFMKSEEATNMLITNLRLSRDLFNKDVLNKNKKFDQWSVVVDVEESLGKPIYEDFFRKALHVHSTIYDLIGDKFTCIPTEISVEDSCFHVLASDFAFDRYHNPFFLEMNAAMGIKGLWKPEEVNEFSEGISYIIDNKDSPYDGRFTNKWVQM